MADDKKPDDLAQRARNRTVMLTPDITGEVRNRLMNAPISDKDDGFVSPGKTPNLQPPHSAPALTPPLASKPQAPTTKASVDSNQPLIGFLVSFDDGPQGEYYELRVGRKVVTSDSSSQGNNLLINHPTVSPMHAILRVAPNGTVQVLDQLSEHGTIISRAGSSESETLSGEKANLEHGDKIQFGERLFIICIISRFNEA